MSFRAAFTRMKNHLTFNHRRQENFMPFTASYIIISSWNLYANNIAVALLVLLA